MARRGIGTGNGRWPKAGATPAKTGLVLGLGLGLGLLLAGCATERPGAGTARAPVASGTMSTLAVAPGQMPGARTTGAPGSAAQTPDALIGAAPARLLATLGRPELQRRERPAEIWQYRGQGCVLDVFLYAVRTDGKQVIHLEARDDAAARTPVASCLDGVVRTRLAS